MIQSTVTIPNLASVSEPIQIQGQAIVRIDCPASITGTTLSLEISTDGVVFKTAVNEAGTAYSIATPSSKSVSLPKQATHGSSRVRLKSSSNETGDKVFTLTIDRT